MYKIGSVLTMRRRTLATVMFAFRVSAADVPATQIPVAVTHEKGTFSGQLAVSLSGSMISAKAKWNATIKNTSAHRVFRATFCVKAFDASGHQIKPGEQDCAIRLWANNWEPGQPLVFKGDQKVRLSDTKTPVQAVKYTIDAIEVFDHSPNLRHLDVRCPLVWTSAIRVFADKKFRPTVMDKDSYTATFAFDGGRVDSGSTNFLKAYTSAYTGWTMTWESFRVDAASLYLREEKPGTCTAELKMSFAGFGKPMFGQYGWYTVESNFNFEKAVMDEVEAQAKRAASSDLDNAISQLPTSTPKPKEDGLTEKLEHLADLHKKGLLTDDEFQKAKAKLLR